MEEQPGIQKAIIRIVGTSHIARKSAAEIRRVAAEFQPDIIAVELDARRLDALKEQAKGAKDGKLPLSMMRDVGVTGYLFLVLGRALQKRIGNVLDVQPGIDMLAAVNIALNEQKPLFLVDQDIIVTMKHLSQKFTFKEKMRVLWDVVSAPFVREKVKFDPRSVPKDDLLKQLIGLLKQRYPSLYNVLIVERNVVMARNLDAIVRKNPGKKILLVIGAGHDDDLRQRLKHLERLATIA